MTTIEIDGSQGEGGAEELPPALALSLVTGTPFRMTNVRAGRKRPGLMRQHLTAVLAAAEVGSAKVTGADISSRELSFSPGPVRAGDYRFSVGTAGSATLVFQTVFPALALASGRSTVVVEGGTHNPMAPPFDFLARAFLPLVARMGPRATAVLERPGFYPAGGGRFRVEIEPAQVFGRLELAERGAIAGRRATAVVALLARSIAERELKVVREKLNWAPECARIEHVQEAVGPGNVVTVEVASEHVTEVFTGFGERGVSAERVGVDLASEVTEYLAAGVPVGRHLADQLLLPMALGGGGSFRTLAPSSHTRTHADLLRAFLGVEVSIERVSDGSWRVVVPPRPD
jgi:RNA 3'-terminal phosphate cyclase (ATP)